MVIKKNKYCLAMAVLGICLAVSPELAAEEFSFELAEIEKKNLTWGGYAELMWEHMDINRGGAFLLLDPAEPGADLDRFSGSLQIDGSYLYKIMSLNWLLKAAGRQDEGGGWSDMADVYEAYASLKPAPAVTAGLGKRSYRWGKGYAWNPVGFINRPKDPNNPEEALEGFSTAELDVIRSFAGPLQTVALTTAVLPVWQGVNEDFGARDNVNLAAKLYVLYRDTDIDLVWYTGNSRTTRYGLDFARNLATNFEIHGELAYTPDRQTAVLQQDGTVLADGGKAFSYLAGLRYLTANDLTGIIEYYHEDAGYTEEEMDLFFQLVADGENQRLASGQETLLAKAGNLSQRGYGRPQPGRDYLYAKFTQQEPFDILYVTPGLIAIVNLDDQSCSISPEVVYTGFTNWELRLRFSYLTGEAFSEFGEKINSSKLELRARCFF
jgi:hypothetical protein